MEFVVENLIFIIGTLALGGLIFVKATILPNRPPNVSAPAAPSAVSSTAPGTTSAAAPAPTTSASSVTHSVKGGEQEGGFFGGFDD